MTSPPDVTGWPIDGEVAALFFVGAALLAWVGGRRIQQARRGWPWLVGAAFCVYCGVQPAHDALAEPGGWRPSPFQAFLTLQWIGIALLIVGIVWRKKRGGVALAVAGMGLMVVMWLVAIGFVIVGLGKLHG